MSNFDLKKYLAEGRLLKEEEKTDLLSFINQKKKEVAKEVGAIRLEDIIIDNLGDVGATGIYNIDGNEMESGISFRYANSSKGTKNFTGEDGAKPRPINVAGEELMYIEYNI